MKITTRLVDRDRGLDEWGNYDPVNRYSEYDVLEDGKPTGYKVIRVGIDHAELRWPDDTDEYLSTDDLRKALPEARRIVAERLARSVTR